MDRMSSRLRSFGETVRTGRATARPETAGTVSDTADATEEAAVAGPDALAHEPVHVDTRVLGATGQALSAEVTADLHRQVDAADDNDSAGGDDETGDEAATSDPSQLQSRVVRTSRTLVEQTARQRLQGQRPPERREAPAAMTADEVTRDARALADGVVPSLFEGLLNQAHRSGKRDRKDVARLLLVVLKAHGAYVYEHCTRLVDLALSLAQEMGERSEQLDREVEDGLVYRDVGEVAFFLTRRSARQRDALAAYLGGDVLAQDAMLHDLGKIQVPEAILYKPGPLDAEERAVMERHPVWGAQILEGLPPLHHAIPVTRHHHERFDGRGYPDGLSGEAIPLAARIVSVVDAFDAMVSDRPYRQGLPIDEVCRIIDEGRGTQFDPRVAEAFLRIVHRVWSPDRQY